MAKFATHMGDPHGGRHTSPQHADPHEFPVWFSLKGPKSREETKGRFRKRVVWAPVPSFRFLAPGNICMYPRSGGFGTGQHPHVPLFRFSVPGNIRQNHPFRNHPFASSRESMWIGVLWAGLRGAMWITHVGGKFRHGLLERSLSYVSIMEPKMITGDTKIITHTQKHFPLN